MAHIRKLFGIRNKDKDSSFMRELNHATLGVAAKFVRGNIQAQGGGTRKVRNVLIARDMSQEQLTVLREKNGARIGAQARRNRRLFRVER